MGWWQCYFNLAANSSNFCLMSALKASTFSLRSALRCFFPRFVCLTCHFFLRFYCCQYVLLGNGCILSENNGFETVEESIQYSFVGFLRQNNDRSTAVIQFFGCIF